MSTLEQVKTILAKYEGRCFSIDPQRKTLSPLDWQGIADECKAASLQCTRDDDGVWFSDGKLTIAEGDGGKWEWVWTQNSNRFFSVKMDAGENND